MKMELSPSTLQEAAYCLFDPSSTSQARRDADTFIHSHLWTSHLPIFLSTLIDELQLQQERGGGQAPSSNVAFLCVTCIDKIVKRDWATLLYQPPNALPEGFLPITPQSAFEQLLSFLIWHVVLHQTPTTNTTVHQSSMPSPSSSRLYVGAGSAARVAMGTVAILIKGGLLDYPNVCARHIEGILGAWETATGNNNHSTPHPHTLHRGIGVRREWSLRRNVVITRPGIPSYQQASSSSSSIPARHATPINLATHLQLLTAIVGAYTTLSPTITVPTEHKASANLFKASLIDDIFATIATIVSDMTVPRHDVLDPEPSSFSFHDAATLYSNYSNNNGTFFTSYTTSFKNNYTSDSAGVFSGGSAIQAEGSSAPSSPSTGPVGRLVHPNFKRPRDDEGDEDDTNNAGCGIVPPRYHHQSTKQPPPASPYAGVLLNSIPEPGGSIATSVPEGLASEEHGNLVRCIDWSIFGNAYIRTQLLYGLHPSSSTDCGVGSLHQEVRCAVEEVQAAVQLLEAVLGFDFMCAIPTVSDTIPASTRLDALSPTTSGPPGTPTSPKAVLNSLPQRPPAPVSQTLHFPATWRPYLSPRDPSRSLFGSLMAVYVSQCSPVAHPQTSHLHSGAMNHHSGGRGAPATLRYTEQALRDSEVPDTALRCLVQLSSCRRTLFDTPEERGMWLRQMLAVCVFLFRNPIHFRSGAPCGLTSLAYYYTRGPSATHTRVGGMVVPSWFHPHLSSTSSHTSGAPDQMTAISTRETFCQLLNRIKPNHQLSELLHEGLLYEVWIHHAAAFTADYMLHTCNRSLHSDHHQGSVRSSSGGGPGDLGALMEHRRVYRDAIQSFISPALGVCFRQGFRTIYYANPLLGLYEGGLLHGADGEGGNDTNSQPPFEYPANSQAGAAMEAIGRLHPNDYNTLSRGCGSVPDGAAEGDPIVTSLMGFWYRLGSALAYASKPPTRHATTTNIPTEDNDTSGATRRSYDPSAPCSYTFVDALLPEVSLTLSYAWVIGDGGAHINDESDHHHQHRRSSLHDNEHDGGAELYIGAVLRQAFPTIGSSFGALSKSLSDRCLAAVTKARHESELMGSGFALSIEEALSDGNGSQDAAKAHRQLSALLRLLTPVLRVRSVSKSISPFLTFLERECLGRRSGSGLSEGQTDMGGMTNSTILLQPTSTMRKGEILARKAALALRSSASSRRSSPVVPSHGPFPEGARRSFGSGGTAPPTSLEDAMVMWDAQIAGSALSYAASIMVLEGPLPQSHRRDAFRTADLSLIRFLHSVVNGIYMAAYGIAAASANSTGIYGGSSVNTVLVSAPATMVQIGRDAPLTPHLAQLLPVGWRDEELGQSLTNNKSSSVDGDLAETMIRLVVLNVQLLAAGRSLQIWGGPNHDSTPYRHNVTEGWDTEAEIVRTAMQLLLASVEQVQFSGPLCETDSSGARGFSSPFGGSHPGDCLPWFVLPIQRREGVSLWQVVAGATRMEHPFPLLEHLATSHNTIMASLQPAGVPPQLPQRRLRADLRRTMCTVFFAHLRQRADLLSNSNTCDRGYSMRASIESFLRPMLGPILRAFHCLTSPAVGPNAVTWCLQAPHLPTTMVFGDGAVFNIDAAGVREFAFAVRSGELGMAFADLRATISSMASRPMFRQGCTDILLSSIGHDSNSHPLQQQRSVLLVDVIFLVLAVCGSHDRFELDRAAGVVVNNNRFEFTQVQGMRFVLEVLLDRSGRMGGGQMEKEFTESNPHHQYHHHAPSSSTDCYSQQPCSTIHRVWDWGAAILAVITASQQRWQQSVFGGQPLPGAFSEAQRTSTAISYTYMYKAGGYLSLRLCTRLHEMGVTHPTQLIKMELGRCTWHLLRTFNSHDLDEFPKLAASYFGLVSASCLLQLHIPLSPPSHSDGVSTNSGDVTHSPSSFYVGRPLLLSAASYGAASWHGGVEWSNEYLEEQWATPHYEGCGRMLSFVLAQPRADIRAVIGNMLHMIRGWHSSHSLTMKQVLLASITALSDLLSTVAVCHRSLQVRSHAERLHTMIPDISTDAQRYLDCTQASLHRPHPVLMAVYQAFIGKVMGYEGRHPNDNHNRWYDTIVEEAGGEPSVSPYGDQLLSNIALAVIGCVLGLEGGTDTVGGYAAPGRVSDIRSAVAGVLVPLFIVCPTAITTIQDSLESRARSREGCGAASKMFARYNNNTSDQDGGGEGGASLLVRKECRQLLDGLHPSSIDTRAQPVSQLSANTPTNHPPYYNPVTYDSRLSHHGVHIGGPHRAPVVIHPSFTMYGDTKSTLLNQTTLQLHLWLGHDLQLDRRTIERLAGNIRLFATTMSGVV